MNNKVTPLALSRSPETKLWRAVLAAAVEDALNEKELDKIDPKDVKYD